VKEREYDEVSGDLAGLQARLRGEEAPIVPPRRVTILPRRLEPQTTPDTIPTLRVNRVDDAVSVSHDDLTVTEADQSEPVRRPTATDRPSVSPHHGGDARVIPMPVRGDGRVSDIARRLARLEVELTDVLHGLEEAEGLLDPTPIGLPVEESTGDPLTDLQRLVARRLETDPGN
jgi:hypothetical protein